jgi:thiol-disulfide isomerase/thioredoxin
MQHHKLLISLSLILAFAVFANSHGGNMPDNWWEDCNAKQVFTWADLSDKLQNEWKHKYVFVDFFMQKCYWCWKALPEFNAFVDNMREEYGDDQVEFIKVDAKSGRDIVSRYGIQSYPTFMVIHPVSGGKLIELFEENTRSARVFKKWALSLMKNVRPLETSYTQVDRVQPTVEVVPESVTPVQ